LLSLKHQNKILSQQQIYLGVSFIQCLKTCIGAIDSHSIVVGGSVVVLKPRARLIHLRSAFSVLGFSQPRTLSAMWIL
jgi:hypothetical protein